MTEAIYLKESYLKEFEAVVVSVEGKFIVLDKTIFYPASGGQDCDTGLLERDDGEEFNIHSVKKMGNDVSHEADKEGLKVGDKVSGKINWERRYKLMRGHTAMHVFCRITDLEKGARITGNQISEDKCRIDLNIKNLDRDFIERCVKKTNEIIAQNLSVTVSFASKEEGLKDGSLVRLAKKELLDKLGPVVRIVSIGDFDRQLDGGTHVKSTREIGKINFLKCDNRGKDNKRIYFSVE